MKKLYIWDELLTECRNYTLEMGTTNIINQEQAGKLGQNQQSVGKQFKLLNVHIYLYLEKNFNNTLWNTPWFNKSRSSSNQPTSNVFCTCADFPVHRHLQFQDFSCPQYFSVYSVFFNFKIVHRYLQFKDFSCQQSAEWRSNQWWCWS